MSDDILRALDTAGFRTVKVLPAQSSYRGCRMPPKPRIIVDVAGRSAFAVSYPKQQIEAVCAVQGAIPRAAQVLKLLDLSDDRSLALVAEAAGGLLWEMEPQDRPSLSTVAQGLNEVLEQLYSVRLVHADLRPWNLYYDGVEGLRVIDWGFSFFIGGRKYINTGDHLRARGHAGRQETLIDKEDVKRTLDVLQHPDHLEAAWNHKASEFGWRPEPWTCL